MTHNADLSDAPSGLIGLLALLLLAAPAHAGLYYSGETVAELPAQWRGFLVDQRLLRTLAAPPGSVRHPLREAYVQAAKALEKTAASRPLTADELADLGAIDVRLGRAADAIEKLRPAQRRFPNHFHIAANLGTAWQMQGDLAQAELCLAQAVKLAPPALKRAEELHLKLVRLRQRSPAPTAPDDLFGVRFGGEPGQLASAERAKLPADATALMQRLALWLPGDGRLLWQLGELANAHGDVRTAAAILDGCVTEMGMSAPALRRRRQQLRAAADELARQPAGDHQQHAFAMKARSLRPLLRHFNPAGLPPVRADRVNPLPWDVLAETLLGAQSKPTFARYLRELDGKRVVLTGFMQPIGEGVDLTSFLLIEYPVGCWFCETPPATGILYVELPPGKAVALKRGPVKVEGTLHLNDRDPEDFLYSIRGAKVTEPE